MIYDKGKLQCIWEKSLLNKRCRVNWISLQKHCIMISNLTQFTKINSKQNVDLKMKVNKPKKPIAKYLCVFEAGNFFFFYNVVIVKVNSKGTQLYIYMYPFSPKFQFHPLLSHFSHVRLCATPQTAAHQAPPSPGFSRQ